MALRPFPPERRWQATRWVVLRRSAWLESSAPASSGDWWCWHPRGGFTLLTHGTPRIRKARTIPYLDQRARQYVVAALDSLKQDLDRRALGGMERTPTGMPLNRKGRPPRPFLGPALDAALASWPGDPEAAAPAGADPDQEDGGPGTRGVGPTADRPEGVQRGEVRPGQPGPHSPVLGDPRTGTRP